MKSKKNWEHLNKEHRKIIANQLGQKKKCVEIARILKVDPTTISKEIKRNRTLHGKGKLNPKTVCGVPNRFPYVCNHCSKRYGSCDLERYVYQAENAHKLATARLVTSRQGINMTPEEFNTLDSVIKEGVDQNYSIYHLVKDTPEINCSVSTVYRLIEAGVLTTKSMDLPRKVKLKKRKRKMDNKKYDYSSNPIDVSNRTYLNYLRFKNQNPGLFHVEMDFLGKLQSDSKSILTLTIPHLHFVLLFLLEKETAQNVYEVFNRLETLLGLRDFQKVFPYILTDRDFCFKNFIQIEVSELTGEIRTHLFYCDAFNSAQKGNVENMNQQLRLFFPKKQSKQSLTQKDLDLVREQINNRRVNSLSGSTPNEAFVHVYGEEILHKLLTQ